MEYLIAGLLVFVSIQLYEIVKVLYKIYRILIAQFGYDVFKKSLEIEQK